MNRSNAYNNMKIILIRGHSITAWTRFEEGGVQKMSVFVHAQVIKTVHAVAKFFPSSC